MARKTARGDEAAAVAAAIARFEAEAGAPAQAPAAVSPWLRAALVEGVGAKESHTEDPGGGARWLS